MLDFASSKFPTGRKKSRERRRGIIFQDVVWPAPGRSYVEMTVPRGSVHAVYLAECGTFQWRIVECPIAGDAKSLVTTGRGERALRERLWLSGWTVVSRLIGVWMKRPRFQSLCVCKKFKILHRRWRWRRKQWMLILLGDSSTIRVVPADVKPRNRSLPCSRTLSE